MRYLGIFLVGLTVVNSTNSMFALRRVLSIGHRGAMGHLLENTLESFERAIEFGVDAIELDIWNCKTGETVVFHDHRLERLTDGNGLISDKSFDELRQLSLGNGEVIPTLEEVLHCVNRRCIVNVELKGPNTAQGAADIIKKFVNEHGWEHSDFIVTSYDQPELQKFNQLISGIPFGPILEGIPLGYAEHAENMGATHLVLCHSSASEEFIADINSRGMQVFVYTVNHPEDIVLMKQLGVHGIITNFPELV